MRLLLLFIVSLLQLATPVKGHAGVAVKKQYAANFESKSAEATLKGHFFTQQSAAELTSLTHVRGNSSQWRHPSFVKHFATGCFANTVFFTQNKLFVQPYLYCKPIRLILVFPEHYFW